MAFRGIVDDIMSDVQTCTKETLITGSPYADARGEHLMEWVAVLDLRVLNNGKPTFTRGELKSHIDVTFVTNKISRRVLSWNVIDKESLSLHKYIKYEFGIQG